VLRVTGDERPARVSHRSTNRALAHRSLEKRQQDTRTPIMYSAIRQDYYHDRYPPARRISISGVLGSACEIPQCLYCVCARTVSVLAMRMHRNARLGIITVCRRPSAVVNLNSVTNRAVRGPEYKLRYDARTIQQHTLSLNFHTCNPHPTVRQTIISVASTLYAGNRYS
jgi:hypothetical protein